MHEIVDSSRTVLTLFPREERSRSRESAEDAGAFVLIDDDEPVVFRFEGVDIAGSDIEPPSMQLQRSRGEALFHLGISSEIVELAEDAQLGELVLKTQRGIQGLALFQPVSGCLPMPYPSLQGW